MELFQNGSIEADPADISYSAFRHGANTILHLKTNMKAENRLVHVTFISFS